MIMGKDKFQNLVFNFLDDMDLFKKKLDDKNQTVLYYNKKGGEILMKYGEYTDGPRPEKHLQIHTDVMNDIEKVMDFYSAYINIINWVKKDLGISDRVGAQVTNDINEQLTKKDYIITESQFKLIVESLPLSFRRRFSKEVMNSYIDSLTRNIVIDCRNFSDEFDFADSIVSEAVDDFMLEVYDYMQGEHIYDENYNSVLDTVSVYTRDWYGEELFELFRQNCEDSDSED